MTMRDGVDEEQEHYHAMLAILGQNSVTRADADRVLRAFRDRRREAVLRSSTSGSVWAREYFSAFEEGLMVINEESLTKWFTTAIQRGMELGRASQTENAESTDWGEVSRIVGEAIGSGSMAWTPRPEGTFDSVVASDIVDRTVEELRSVVVA